MYIATNETATIRGGIMNYMPSNIRRRLFNINLDEAREIRISHGKPISIYYNDGCFFVNARGNLSRIPNNAIRASRADIDEALELASKSSVYSVRDEIKNGFITISGGHRIGITGTAVGEGGKIDFLKDISGLNYRLAREVIGAADKIMDKIIHNSEIKNTLIISPPGAGKTTLLRDIARQLSYKGARVSIVDERREIAAVCEGRSAFDLGFSADILEGASKAEGMLLMLRSMSPEVIITDEIGKIEDVTAIEKIINSGVKIITTVHAENRNQLFYRRDLREVCRYFDVMLTLSKRRGAGTIEEIYIAEDARE
jgi:stage III sporulation protein AA